MQFGDHRIIALQFFATLNICLLLDGNGGKMLCDVITKLVLMLLLQFKRGFKPTGLEREY